MANLWEDGKFDPPDVKVENNEVPLVDQLMWDIELAKHLMKADQEWEMLVDGELQTGTSHFPYDDSELNEKYAGYEIARAKRSSKRYVFMRTLIVFLKRAFKSLAYMDPHYAYMAAIRKDV